MKTKWLQWLCDKTRLDKKIVILMLVGLSGIILLTVTELLPSGEEKSEETVNSEQSPYQSYAQNIETRLEELISSIHGAGKTRVMVTLDSSDENVYATERKRTDNKDNSTYEDNVVIIETESGENGVLLKITEPKIRGVAVVCAGGDSPVVRQSIIDTVTAVLDISSARVNIATMKTDNGG